MRPDHLGAFWLINQLSNRTNNSCKQSNQKTEYINVHILTYHIPICSVGHKHPNQTQNFRNRQIVITKYVTTLVFWFIKSLSMQNQA